MDPRVQYATTSDGVSIAFWSLGEGLPVIQMPPIPYSHIGLEAADDHRRWYDVVSDGCRLIRYDNRGSGLSDREAPDYSLDALLLDVDAVADKLGLETFALIGIVPSTPVAIAYAASRPERVSRLGLWSPFAATEEIASSQAMAIRSLRERDFTLYTETMAHAMIAGWAAGDAARRYAEFMRECVDHERANLLEISQNVDVRDLLPSIQCPTLVIQRREAQFASAEVARRVAARIPNSEFVLQDGGALLPWVGDMETAADTILNFLGASPARTPKTGTTTPVAAPSGLVTVLFSDIEASTELTQRLGDAPAREVFREHERIVRSALQAHGGSEVKTMGDGFMASFGSATRALECAIAIQRDFQSYTESSGHPLRVRIGLNTGEPIAEADDLFGTAVIAASRIAARARGGEILVANVVRELVAGKGFLFSDMGETILRGFEDPVRLYQLLWQSE